MVWQPLHVRQAKVEEGLYEGVADHLRPQLWDWAAEAFLKETTFDRARIQYICNMARLTLSAYNDDQEMFIQLKHSCLGDDTQFLSVIDALLNKLGSLDPDWVGQLDEHLLVGNSAWVVAPDRKSLTRRVDPSAEAAVTQAVAPHDAASEELGEAWRKAYGQDTDPSDAWDHSIKAIEHILKPVVSPTKAKATLGTIVGDLRAQAHLWKLALPGKDSDFSVDRLVSILNLIWPNPDRHGGGTPTAVTLNQAQAVVHLAVTVVQWGRAGVLTKR